MLQRYYKAYLLRDLRQYIHWTENVEDPSSLAEDVIVYVREDYVVAADVLEDAPAIFTEVTPEWRHFCHEKLGFRVPDLGIR